MKSTGSLGTMRAVLWDILTLALPAAILAFLCWRQLGARWWRDYLVLMLVITVIGVALGLLWAWAA